MADPGPLPDSVQDAPPATQRVYDALVEAGDSLTRTELQCRTRHAGTTVRESLRELRDLDVVEKRGSWPTTPEYALVDS